MFFSVALRYHETDNFYAFVYNWGFYANFAGLLRLID